MASRRLEWVDRQVKWIDRALLNGRPSCVLDLGCGPGLYSHRMAALGHRCRGIDFGPASVEYARQHNPDPSKCEFLLGDIRRVSFGGPYDLAMILFGEMNVFSPGEILGMLRNVHECLVPRAGRLIVEVQNPVAVEQIGKSNPSEQQYDSGLFSDRPHRCRIQNRWLPDQQVAIQEFTIMDADGSSRIYHSTTRAWRDEELIALLKAAGFMAATLRENWPCNTSNLALWSAETGF